MAFVVEKKVPLSRIASKVAIGAVVATALLDIAHGIMEGHLHSDFAFSLWFPMLLTWCVDFRYLTEQLIYAGAIVFIGAKFIETRTIFTVGFDKLDTEKVALNGPDENNIVWIGHRYGSALEAQTVADAIESRLKESAG